MSAQYMPLQGDPPPYTDIERGDSQAEPTNTGNDNECLKPGELARMVHRDNSDEIVKVVPMRAGWDSSSTIEVKQSALPELRSPRTIIGWVLISYFLACSNYRFLSSEWATTLMLFMLLFPLAMAWTLVLLVKILKSLLALFLSFSIHILFFAILQLIVTVVCYHEEREYFVGTLFALIAMVLSGSFTIFAIYSDCYEQGEAALAAVTAAESGTADECSESHALPALSHSQPAGGTAQDSEQNVEPSQSSPQQSQVPDLGTARVVRHDPIIKVVPFGGDRKSSYIIVRRSALPLRLRRVALLSQFLWMLIPLVVILAGAAANGPKSFKVAFSGVTMGGLSSVFQIFSFDWSLNGTWPGMHLWVSGVIIVTVSLKLAMTVASCYDSRTCFAYNLGALVLLVLFGILSTAVIYQYNYRAGQAALNALEAERAKSSLPEDDDSRECDPTNKKAGR